MAFGIVEKTRNESKCQESGKTRVVTLMGHNVGQRGGGAMLGVSCPEFLLYSRVLAYVQIYVTRPRSRQVIATQQLARWRLEKMYLSRALRS